MATECVTCGLFLRRVSTLLLVYISLSLPASASASALVRLFAGAEYNVGILNIDQWPPGQLEEAQQIRSYDSSHATLRSSSEGIQNLPARRIMSMCTYRDISISQSRDITSGIPQFVVQIVISCMIQPGCSPSEIHVYCGSFASAQVVNPNLFKRVADNDCLVNGGRPIHAGQIIRFTYQNSYMYPIRFKSAKFC